MTSLARSTALLCTVSLLSTGCYAKFKKAAPFIDTINVQTYLTGAPYVSLGTMNTDADDGAVANVIGAIVNTAQAVKNVEMRRLIEQAVDINAVNVSVSNGVAEGLGTGPPFAYGTSDRQGMVQLEVLSYGMDVVAIGAPGQFTYDVRTTVYDADGRRVYRNRTNCSTGVGMPKAVSEALWTVNNVKQLKEMPPEEIHAAFDAVAYWCGTEIALKMRRHAG